MNSIQAYKNWWMTPPKTDILIIMGDADAKVGKQRTADVTGNWGLGKQNEKGEKLVDCIANNMVITNMWFQQPKKKTTLCGKY